MTPRSKRRAKRPLAPSPAPMPLIALGTLVLTAMTVSGLAPAQADVPTGGHQGKILSMQTVHTGRLLSYDITVTSPDEFPMRDEIVNLAIGGQTFDNSHYLPGGDLNTLVFSLTQKQFQSLPTGATAIVYYGQDDAAIPKARWVLGVPDKNMLDKRQAGGPITVPILDNPVAAAPILGGPVAAKPPVGSPSAPARVLTGRVKAGHGSAPNVRAATPQAVSQQKGKK